MNEAASPPALWLENIARRYGRGETVIEVLNGADLALWPGQSVALIAPSGAGKSTLLHLAGLLETPDAGEVHVGGAPTAKMSDDQRTALRRSEIGFVYQFHHLLPEFSAAENIILPQMIRGPAASRGARAGERTARLSRPRRARKPSPRRTVGRRTAAGRDRPSRRQRPARAAGGRADGQPRPQDCGPCVCDADGAGEGEPRCRVDCHAQSRSGRPHGPPRDAPRRPGRGDGIGAAPCGARPAAPQGRSPKPRAMKPAVLTALIIATALFMENMDGTVLATSLPRSPAICIRTRSS